MSANGAAPMLTDGEAAPPPSPPRRPPARPVVTASPALAAELKAIQDSFWDEARPLYMEQRGLDKVIGCAASRGSGPGAGAWVAFSDAVAKAATLVPATIRGIKKKEKRKVDAAEGDNDS
jgi:hypothetical protein